MVKNILCRPCKLQQQETVANFPNEQLVIKSGMSVKDQHCDWCNVQIIKGEDCYATTLLINKYSEYQPWEKTFIQET